MGSRSDSYRIWAKSWPPMAWVTGDRDLIEFWPNCARNPTMIGSVAEFGLIAAEFQRDSAVPGGRDSPGFRSLSNRTRCPGGSRCDFGRDSVRIRFDSDRNLGRDYSRNRAKFLPQIDRISTAIRPKSTLAGPQSGSDRTAVGFRLDRGRVSAGPRPSFGRTVVGFRPWQRSGSGRIGAGWPACDGQRRENSGSRHAGVDGRTRIAHWQTLKISISYTWSFC